MSQMAANLAEAAVRQHCKALHLPTVGAQCLRLAQEAERAHQSYLGYLEALLGTEVEERERNGVAQRIKDAHLPKVKTLEEFDFSQAPAISATKIAELAEGGYIERAEPVVFIGECRHRQDAPAHRVVRGGLPAETAGALHHGGGIGQRAGGGQAATRPSSGAGPMGRLRPRRHRRGGIRSPGRGRRGTALPGRSPTAPRRRR